MLFAASLAVKEWNQRGGVSGRYIEMVAQDDHDGADAGALQARKMALDPQMLGVVGHPARVSATAAAAVYRQAGLPVLIVGSPLASEGPPVFQMGLAGPQAAKEIARLAGSREAGRLAVITGGGSPDVETADSQPSSPSQTLVGAAGEAGLDVVLSVQLPNDEDGYARLLAALGKARPDLVYFEGNYMAGAGLLERLRTNGVSATFLGGPGMATPDLLRVVGLSSAGAFYLASAPSPDILGGASSFVSTFRGLSGTSPWPQAALTYDAVNAMLSGIEQAAMSGKRPGRAELKDNLLNGAYQGITGLIAFDGQGSRVNARGYIYRIEGGAWPGTPVQ